MSRKVSLSGALSGITADMPPTKRADAGPPPAAPAAAPAEPASSENERGAPARRPASPTQTTAARSTVGERRSAAAASTDAGAGPRWTQLVRKEARLREDQAEQLTLLARRLSRSKPAGGERITDNTLIRVAVDLLLQHEERLAGTTEDELRTSVTT